MTLRRMRQEEAEEEVAHAEEAAHAHAVGGAPTAEKTRKADDSRGDEEQSSCVERLWDPSRLCATVNIQATLHAQQVTGDSAHASRLLVAHGLKNRAALTPAWAA